MPLPHVQVTWENRWQSLFLMGNRIASIAWVNFRQDAIRALLAGTTGLPRTYAWLVREPQSQYDANAVAVHVRGVHIGYLKRELAAVLAREFDDILRSRWARV